jgi:hypothetical protein
LIVRTVKCNCSQRKFPRIRVRCFHRVTLYAVTVRIPVRALRWHHSAGVAIHHDDEHPSTVYELVQNGRSIVERQARASNWEPQLPSLAYVVV